MNEVEFREEYIESKFNRKESSITNFVVKYSGGLVNNESQAGYLLIFLSVVLIFLALFLFKGSTPNESTNTGQQFQTPSELGDLR